MSLFNSLYCLFDQVLILKGEFISLSLLPIQVAFFENFLKKIDFQSSLQTNWLVDHSYGEMYWISKFLPTVIKTSLIFSFFFTYSHKSNVIRFELNTVEEQNKLILAYVLLYRKKILT